MHTFVNAVGEEANTEIRHENRRNTEIQYENRRNAEMGCEIEEIQKLVFGAPAERLVTCHCGCTLLSIVAEKKRVREKGKK